MSGVAFIGLGNMGLPMAMNLLKAGHAVTAFDAMPAALETATRAGLPAAKSVADAVAGAAFIVTMLPNGPIVLSVFEQILSAARKGALVIDCSTIDVASARRLHQMAETAGLLSLDAPVSGGTTGAGAATLTFMAGGTREAFDKGAVVLKSMGSKLVHCGPGGSGQAAKICNNMLLAVSMIGACEAFALAEKLDLSPQAAFDVISTSSGSCWSVNTYCPVPGVGPMSPADNNFKPGFTADLMAKDLRLARQAASETGQVTPLGAHALQLYEAFLQEGGAGRDFSAIIEYLKAGAGRSVG
jgi:3-hydroxyisobutyrate dehydrogenase